MSWTNKQVEILENEYPNPNISIYDICKKIGKSRKAIGNKACRECIHRSKSNIDRKYKNKQDAKIIQKRYWDNNKDKIINKRKLRRRELKKELVLSLGGKCKKCGIISKQYCIYEFHHTDKNKDNDIASLIANTSIKKAKEEVKKCILLCANCHKIEHFGNII